MPNRLRESLVKHLLMNQFRDGPRKGEFGVNTDFLSREQYHSDYKEAVRLTPQIFLTYVGMHAALYAKTEDGKEGARLAASFTKSLLVNNVVQIQRPFRSPDRDNQVNEMAINYRHSALAHSILLSYFGSDVSTKAFVKTLLEQEIQNDDGGWPEWSIAPRVSNIISSIYITHFLHHFIDLQPDDEHKVIIERAICDALSFLKKHHTKGLWHQEDEQGSIRFYPTMYFLILPALLHAEGAQSSIIQDYPHLVKRLSRDGWMDLIDSTKVYRTTVRYVTNLYLNSFFDERSAILYKEMKAKLMSELEANLPELNTHEILGLLLMIDNVRFDPHSSRRIDTILSRKRAGEALDWLSPLLEMIPIAGPSLYEYYAKIKDFRRKNA